MRVVLSSDPPILAPIPPGRLNASRLFAVTTMDFGGPFEMVMAKVRKSTILKVYFCVYLPTFSGEIETWPAFSDQFKLNLNALLDDTLPHATSDILTAHCTCMAGLSEACSHMGQILYFFYLTSVTKAAPR